MRKIPTLGPMRRHYWLASSMAKATGVDLNTAMEEGRLSHEDWAVMIRKCQGCQWVEGCEHWMGGQMEGAAAIPQACPNCDRLQDLKL